MRICIPRAAAVTSTALLVGLLAACGPEGEHANGSSSEVPSTSATSNPKPTTGEPTAPSAKASAASSSKTASTPSGEKGGVSSSEPADPAKNDPEIEQLDIGLTHNSNCSPGVTIGLSKIVGWEDGPFTAYVWFRPAGATAYVEYATTPYSGANANPMDDWHFVCDDKAAGQYRLKFVSDNVDVSPTEPVNITVS